MTADIVNLNRMRKARVRVEKDKQAEANRRQFGASKAEKAAIEDERKRRDSTLDGAERQLARLDDGHDDLDPGTVS